MSDKPYIFDTKGTDIGRQHLSYVETLMDPTSIEMLNGTDIGPGQRCLDLGAGAGSITQWMADKVGPSGSVVAVDKNINFVEPRDNIETHEYDLTEGGLPVDGQFDLIHARLILMHLPQREAIFKTLVDALAPGGWLVIGDFSGRKHHVLDAPTEADKELWTHIMHLSHGVVGDIMGINMDWAFEMDGHMTSAGLKNLHSVEYSQSASGGSAGCLMHRNLNIQAEPLLLKHGATPEELERYRALMLDPAFRVWFYQMICTRAQKPAA